MKRLQANRYRRKELASARLSQGPDVFGYFQNQGKGKKKRSDENGLKRKKATGKATLIHHESNHGALDTEPDMQSRSMLKRTTILGALTARAARAHGD